MVQYLFLIFDYDIKIHWFYREIHFCFARKQTGFFKNYISCERNGVISVFYILTMHAQIQCGTTGARFFKNKQNKEWFVWVPSWSFYALRGNSYLRKAWKKAPISIWDSIPDLLFNCLRWNITEVYGIYFDDIHLSLFYFNRLQLIRNHLSIYSRQF